MINSVSYLQNTRFSRLTLAEKIRIKSLGRPTPNLIISQGCKGRNSKSYTRKFSRKLYDDTDWLCGCDVTNAFFCFPCLLFGGERSWTVTGQTDLRNLGTKIKRHSKSEQHLKYVLDLSMLGQSNIALALDSGYALSIARHNAEVMKNRDTLSKIINIIKVCGKCELPLRGHDETSDSDNPGVFRSILDLVCEHDSSLKLHLESGKAFKGTSKTIQNDILESILKVCKNQIKQEVAQSKYLAVMCDDTTDVSEKTQMVIIIRYELNGKIFERFWSFFNPQNQTAKELSDILLKEIEKLIGNSTTKLIAQCYDGAATLSGARNGVQSIVKRFYPHAYFIHCYAHKLNLILQKATSVNKNVKVFFNSLSGIPEFFSKSPQRMAALEKAAAGHRIPRPSSTRWNFLSRTVNAVHEMKPAIIQSCSDLESTSQQTGFVATGIKNTLQSPSFEYWLNLFAKIMPHVEILFNQMQSRQINSVFAQSCVDAFKSQIQSVRNNIGGEQPLIDHESNSNNTTVDPNAESSLHVQAKEVCDVIMMQCKERFKFTGHLVAARLLQQSNYSKFSEDFPDQLLDETVQFYPHLIKEKLKTELTVFYARNDINSYAKLTDLMLKIYKQNLVSSFSELLNLLQILVVTPMTTSEAERCFSTLRRVKSFLRSTSGEDRLSALAMLSIEKRMVAEHKDFNQEVIDYFCSMKSRRMDFILK